MEIPKEIINPVIDYFNGDLVKVSVWINMPNPMLGGVSPCHMILSGKQDKLIKFIDGQISLNHSISHPE